MAFSKQPDIATYKTVALPLAHQVNSRAGSVSKDVDYLNVFFEVTQNRDTKEQSVDIYTRPGYATWSDALQSTQVRAVYFWESRNKWYVWIDDDLQIIDGALGTIDTTITGVLGTSSGDVGVTEFLYDTGEVKLVFTDGTSLKTIDSSNTVVASSSPDLPSPIKTTIVFLDGYLFIVDSDTQDIVNSNLNDPLAYTAGDFISAEMLPDTMIGIGKVNNYLVAFGMNSIEYFWDAANESGSPLQRNDTPVKFNGILSTNSLATHGNKVYFVGNQNETSPTVFVLEDFKIKAIGNESLRRHMAAASSAPSSYRGAVISVLGNDFYIISDAVDNSYVVNVEHPDLWTRWAETGGNQLAIRFANTVKASSSTDTIFYVHGKQYLFKFDRTITTDAGSAYTWRIVTPVENFDSYNQKVINRLTIVGDRPSADTTISVSWTDDDYQSYQTAQTVNLNQDIPCIYQLGSFRRRAFKLTCTPTVPFRVRALEVDINLGNS